MIIGPRPLISYISRRGLYGEQAQSAISSYGLHVAAVRPPVLVCDGLRNSGLHTPTIQPHTCTRNPLSIELISAATTLGKLFRLDRRIGPDIDGETRTVILRPMVVEIKVNKWSR